MNTIVNKMIKTIQSNRRDRELAYFGSPGKVRKIIAENLEGNNDAKLFTTNRKLLEKDKAYSYYTELDNKNNYYVICPFIYGDGKRIESILHERGFERNIDYYIYPLCKLDVKEKSLNYIDPGKNSYDIQKGFKGHLHIEGEDNRIEIADLLFETNARCSITIVGSNNKVVIGNGVSLINSSEIIIKGDNSQITIGNGSRLPASRLSTGNNCKILIGDKTTLGSGTKIHAHSNSEIVIGKDCMFSWNVILQTGDGHAIFDVITGERANAYGTSRLVIKDHVWLARESMVIGGKESVISEGSIIGANSCVKGIFRENNVAIVGNPAKVIKRNVAWARNPDAESIEQCGDYANPTET